MRDTPPAAYLQHIGTATPSHDIHAAFTGYARELLATERERQLFDRMAARSGIEHRYAVLRPGNRAAGEIDAEGFYRPGHFPNTAERMALYAHRALPLALNAVHALAPPDVLAARLARVTHLVVASCTGLHAPGLDVGLVDALGLSPDVQRTNVAFMGCAASLPALRVAQQAVLADPDARALVVCVELCSLHLHESASIDELLSFLLFADGAAAVLVGREPVGARIIDFRTRLLPASRELLTWQVGARGFTMHLSGRVPGALGEALALERERHDSAGLLRGHAVADHALWAVHTGGRSVLDAVQGALRLPPSALAGSRAVLQAVGNLSSATLLFVLRRLLAAAPAGRRGMALAFGPGLTAESMVFETVGA
jgi:alpha-pyrone synthase